MTSAIEYAAALEALYRRIGERSMHDLPIYNEALAVEAVGFDAHDDAISGILITPWFMNLMLLPLDGSLAARALGSSFSHGFPVGMFDFTVGDIEGVGRIASCSLFSPMFEFADMAAARATAAAAMAEIRNPEPEQPKTRVVAALDRRSFLRGALTEPRP
ncbi:MAG: [NiFe]-hydrogenase assembly chaperone HybE [Rhodopseudomonas sp.]|uniref:[NiFe]-hydrogenase assembly chaperone HybE n=1 Tax=Rhodopseudomonas sp. TaxID=1078 RepID=UPI0017CB26A4|nr:[NiFe]-hydrogenase assembly chaperone HybE [Rhodopseudomonas sp.]NVN85479.1 [NiFe]-hydrogenase assembly chaperone HybE [Rhodopseudomonas sp.]